MITSLMLGMALATTGAEKPMTEITIYNGGYALVKEVRQLNLKEGRQSVLVEDVAQLIEPTSVGMRSLTRPGSFAVLEQSYQYDLISVAAILNKAVGQKIVLNRVLPNGQKERVSGTLLSAPSAVVGSANGQSSMVFNGMVLRTDDGRILLDPSGEIEVSSIPDGLISKPTLVWDLEADQAGPNQVELSYITQGTGWRADYVLTLDQDGKDGDLKSWVTITNNSGATWKDARLKLLAGDVLRVVQQQTGGFGGGRRGAPEAAMADRGFQQEQFADYHLYTLQRPATVRNNEIKQVSLFDAFDVPVVKRLIVDPMNNMRGYRPSEGETGTGLLKPQIRIEFKNSQANKLGMPFPEGIFKVFQRDSTGAVQLLGEDNIEHTPRDEMISLVVGRAFDVVAERKRTAFEWIRDGERNPPRGARETFEIEVRNRKEQGTETVTLLERFWAEYKIINNNMDYKKLNNETLEFLVTVKAGETKKVVFTVETRW